MNRLVTAIVTSAACAALTGTAALAQSPAPASGSETSTPEMTRIFACKSETDPMARLACFDAAVGKLEAANNSGEVVVISKAEVQKVERDAFGFSIPSLGGLGNLFGGSESDEDKAARKLAKEKLKSQEVRSITSRIVKVSELNNDRYRFYLENGQVWTQTDTDTFRKPRKKDGEWPIVVIEKGALGGFKLKVGGKGRSMRVKRTG